MKKEIEIEIGVHNRLDTEQLESNNDTKRANDGMEWMQQTRNKPGTDHEQTRAQVARVGLNDDNLKGPRRKIKHPQVAKPVKLHQDYHDEEHGCAMRGL